MISRYTCRKQSHQNIKLQMHSAKSHMDVLIFHRAIWDDLVEIVMYLQFILIL